MFTHWPPHPVSPLAQQTPLEFVCPAGQQMPEEQLPLVHCTLLLQLPLLTFKAQLAAVLLQ